VDHLLQILRVKGRATPEALAAALDADPNPHIDSLLADGLIEETRFGYKVTHLGSRRVAELYAREREEAGPVIMDVYDSFIPINDDVKQIVTDWQMRTVGGTLVPNDHSDPRHDDKVIGRLHTTDAKVSAALAPLTAALGRFEVYPRRLRRALDRIGEGDHTMVAAPIKDSYHTVWFELHEELLTLADQKRVE
jgi:pyruvate,orthophosphate dikinase